MSNENSKPELEFVVAPEPGLVQIVGPFRGDIYRLVVDGCRVPYIELTKNEPHGPHEEWERQFEWYMVLDGRFGHFIRDDEEVKRWGYLLANAMAVSAGFTSHGPNSKPMNRHSVQMIGLSPGEFEDLQEGA